MTRRGPLADGLSVELLFWRSKQIDRTSGDGITFAAAREALLNLGQCHEAFWPYALTRDITRSYDPPAAAIEPVHLKRATMAVIAPDTGAITDALRTERVVVVGLQLWDGFYECDSTTITAPAGDIDATARHAVCIVGLEEASDKVMIRNSWGTHWGEAGYAWLDFGALKQVLLEAWVVDDDLELD